MQKEYVSDGKCALKFDVILNELYRYVIGLKVINAKIQKIKYQVNMLRLDFTDNKTSRCHHIFKGLNNFKYNLLRNRLFHKYYSFHQKLFIHLTLHSMIG